MLYGTANDVPLHACPCRDHVSDAVSDVWAQLGLKAAALAWLSMALAF